MPVDPGAEGGFRVVDVKDRETLESDHLVELGKGFGRALRCGEIVSRREGVGRVEADFQTLRILDRVDDLRDFLKARTEAGSLTRCCLEGDPDLELRMLGMELVEISHDASDPCLRASA